MVKDHCIKSSKDYIRVILWLCDDHSMYKNHFSCMESFFMQSLLKKLSGMNLGMSSWNTIRKWHVISLKLDLASWRNPISTPSYPDTLIIKQILLLIYQMFQSSSVMIIPPPSNHISFSIHHYIYHHVFNNTLHCHCLYINIGNDFIFSR